MKAVLYKTVFTVKGNGARAFPIDLLRIEKCWPATTLDSKEIYLSQFCHDLYQFHERIIKLEIWHEERNAPIHDGYWKEMGWEVVREPDAIRRDVIQ